MDVFVKNRMTAQTIAVDPGQTLAEAYRIMKENDFEGLPVMADGAIAGVITEGDILNRALVAGGIAALSETPVREAMATQVVTVNEDDIIEEAAFLLHKHDIGILPVVDDYENLVGVITESDLFSVFVDMLGLRARGTRITLRVEDRVGMLANITQVVKQSHVSIASLATFATENAPSCIDVVMRLKTVEPKETVDALRRAGFRVIHVSQVWE